MNPEGCVYTIRLRNADGSERLITRPCPYLEACRDQGRSCSEGAGLPGDPGRSQKVDT